MSPHPHSSAHSPEHHQAIIAGTVDHLLTHVDALSREHQADPIRLTQELVTLTHPLVHRILRMPPDDQATTLHFAIHRFAQRYEQLVANARSDAKLLDAQARVIVTGEQLIAQLRAAQPEAQP